MDHIALHNLLTVCPQVSSADTLCKQFGPISGYKLFDTQMVVLKEFFQNVVFLKKNQQMKKKMKIFPRGAKS